jgi:hypothetical protein
MLRRFSLAALAILLVSAYNAAEAWQAEGSGSWTLSATQTQVIYNSGGGAVHAAVAVTVTTGSVQIQKDVSGWTNITTLASGEKTIIEGLWTSVRVRAVTASTGSYVTRSTAGGTSWLMGTITVDIGSTAKRVYLGDGSFNRWLRVGGADGVSTAEIRTSSSGSVLMTIDPNDEGVVEMTTTEYWVSGSGVAVITAEDPKPDPWSDWMKFQRHETQASDKIYDPADSNTECRDYEVKNTGTNKFKVKYKPDGGAAQEVEVDPSDTFAFNCDMDYVNIEYSGNGGASGEWRHKKHS